MSSSPLSQNLNSEDSPQGTESSSAAVHPEGDLRNRPEYRLVAQYLTAVLDTFRRHYDLDASPGILYRKGTGEEPQADMALLFGGSNGTGRVLFSLGGEQAVFDAILARGPKGETSPVKTLMDLVGASVSRHAGPVKEFRGVVPAVVRGSGFIQKFLTTGKTAVVPLTTPCGPLTLQISREFD